MFGAQESLSARMALDIFREERCKAVLELGAGQGRDTIFFVNNDLRVHAIDYSTIGLDAILAKARELDLVNQVNTTRHDIRRSLPFEDNTFDACYSHMLYCMDLSIKELEFLSSEILRVLRPNGINIYTARNINDKHYKMGNHKGEKMHQIGDFIVHFFDKEQIKHLSKGYKIVDVKEFEEGHLPRKLYFVVLKKK